MRAFISLGSNIRPEENLPLAVKRLGALGPIIAISNVYQNPAIGPTQQADFLNAAVLIETDLEINQLRDQLRLIESDLGRVRTEDKFAPRTIDLDLCLLEDTVHDEQGFKLPDPDLLTRAFLALTLAELDPDFKHPLTGERLLIIADRLANSSELVTRPDVSGRLRNPP